MIIVQTNPETEMLVFSGGDLTLEGGNLIVVARHARIDGDTVIRAFTRKRGCRSRAIRTRRHAAPTA